MAEREVRRRSGHLYIRTGLSPEGAIRPGRFLSTRLLTNYGHARTVIAGVRYLSEIKMKYGVPWGSRTPVAAVKGRCPRPLDEGDGIGGARRDRTADLYNAIVALSQLSYGPICRSNVLKQKADRLAA